MRIPRRLVRFAATGYYRLRRAAWFLAGGRGEGVHAVPLTPRGEVVLVRLTYVPGWRLPGGGRGRGEDREAAVLRELREEIGLERHGKVRAADGTPDPGYFVVHDVEYEPRRSLEVEEVRAFPPDALPADMPPADRRIAARTVASQPSRSSAAR